MDEITGEVLVAAPHLDLRLVRKSKVVVRCLDNDSGQPVSDCRCASAQRPPSVLARSTTPAATPASLYPRTVPR